MTGARLVFLDRDDPGWRRAWDVLAGWFGDLECSCPTTGEVWQYMGTEIVGEGGRHTFRHRSLPAGPVARARDASDRGRLRGSRLVITPYADDKTGPRVYLDVPVAPGDFEPREVAP